MGKLREQFDALTKMPNGTNTGPASPARRQADAKRAATGALMLAMIDRIEGQAEAIEFLRGRIRALEGGLITEPDPDGPGTVTTRKPERRVPAPQARKP